MAARKGKSKSRKKAKRSKQAPLPAGTEARVDYWPTLDRVLRAHKNALVFLAMAAVLAAGWSVRFVNIYEWETQPKRFFYQEEPLLINLDGYFYLRLARDLSEHHYDPVDQLRRVPDTPSRPSPPPLISVLVSWIHSLTSWSFNWIAVILPALLGPLLAFPVYGVARLLGGGIPMRITAAMMSILSVEYARRTMVGFFDTDCLILTFVMGIIYCSMRFALEPKRRFLFLLLGLLLFGLLLWWWDQAPEVVTIIGLFPLTLAMIFYVRPTKKQWLILGGAGLTLILAFIILAQGASFFDRFFAKVVGLFNYISGRQVGDFANVSRDVSEQNYLPLTDIVASSTGSFLVFAASMVGVGWLSWTKRSIAGFLLVPAIFAAFGLFFGARFLVYLAPITALGIGFLIDLAWRRRRMLHFPILTLVFPLAMLVLAWPAFSKMVDTTFFPVYLDRLPAFDAVANITPEDAVIWTSWDTAYPLMYYAKRATIADGQFHGGEIQLYSYLPLVTDDFRLAANFMQFYIKNGTSGVGAVYRAMGGDKPGGMRLLKEVLSAGPKKARIILSQSLASSRLNAVDGLETVDQWLHFFFPSDTPPIYLLLHERFATAPNWFIYGSWDLEKRRGTTGLLLPAYRVREVDGRIKGSKGLDFDRQKGGKFSAKQFGKEMFRNTPISEMIIHTGQGLEVVTYDARSRLRFEWIKPRQFGAMMDENVANSVFNRLFIRHTAPSAYFQERKVRTPSYQVWEVKGDRL